MIDVLVVGAGPTGLVAGIELQRRGVRVRVVDAAPGPSPLSRAIVVHARTLEVLEDHGLSERLVSEGVALGRVHLYSNGTRRVDLGFGELSTRYPFLLSLPQTRTEAALEDHFRSLGGEVERGVTLRAFEQDRTGVSAELSTGPVRTAWLLGCDGAHSAVRHGLGLPFDGHALDERLLLGDVRWDTSLPRDVLSSFLRDEGFVGCFPLPDGRWRLIATRADDDLDAEPTLDRLQRVVTTRIDTTSTVSDPAWLAHFKIHSRQVPRYREGRVMLAGDAAHIHSPAGGQGMNTGIQDAHNLGWKLAAVVAGHCPEMLLDTYSAERHPIAAEVLGATDRATRLGTTRSPILRALRDVFTPALAQVPAVRDRVLRAVAELDVSYRGRPHITQVGPGVPAAGERWGRGADLPRLLLFTGPRLDEDGRRRLRACIAIARGAFADRLWFGLEPDPAGVEADGALLLRPDGYVHFRLSPADPVAVLAALEAVFGPVRT